MSKDKGWTMEDSMQLSTKAFTIACALLWGVLVMGGTGLMNLIFPPYGEHFLLTMSSLYPGYHATRSIGEVLVGTGYGVTDAAVGGFLFAWVYNYFTA